MDSNRAIDNHLFIENIHRVENHNNQTIDCNNKNVNHKNQIIDDNGKWSEMYYFALVLVIIASNSSVNDWDKTKHYKFKYYNK